MNITEIKKGDFILWKVKNIKYLSMIINIDKLSKPNDDKYEIDAYSLNLHTNYYGRTSWVSYEIILNHCEFVDENDPKWINQINFIRTDAVKRELQKDDYWKLLLVL